MTTYTVEAALRMVQNCILAGHYHADQDNSKFWSEAEKWLERACELTAAQTGGSEPVAIHAACQRTQDGKHDIGSPIGVCAYCGQQAGTRKVTDEDVKRARLAYDTAPSLYVTDKFRAALESFAAAAQS